MPEPRPHTATARPDRLLATRPSRQGMTSGSDPPSSPDRAQEESGSAPARAIQVAAVVRALGLEIRRKRERAARLRVAAELLERAAEAELGVVVGRAVIDDRAELRRGLLVALRAEQGAAKRLPDRVLVGLQLARPAQRDRCSMEVALLQKARPVAEELVDVGHAFECKTRGGSAHQPRSRPNGPRPAPSTRRSSLRCSRVGTGTSARP